MASVPALKTALEPFVQAEPVNNPAPLESEFQLYADVDHVPLGVAPPAPVKIMPAPLISQ